MSYIFGLVIIVTLASIALAQTDYPDINITIEKSIPDYLIQYPDAKVTKLTNIDSKGWTGWKYFEFGTSVPGETRLARAVNTLNLQTLQDVSIEFTYLTVKKEFSISRVELWVTVDSNPADYCYITSIGESNSSISVWIQSKATTTFSYSIDFYGHKVSNSPSIKIQIANTIEDILTLYPSNKIVKMNQAMQDSKTTRFYFGDWFGGSTWVTSAVGAYSFPVAKDVALTLAYPPGFLSEQTIEVLLTESNAGKASAYIIYDQDYNQNNKIWINSTRTTIFNYSVKIYDYWLE